MRGIMGAMKRQHGFTVIELIFVIAFAGLATGLLLYQKSEAMAAQRDDARKTAINAMYYNLEEVFYEKNGYYPVKIDSKTLRAMDPQLFTDSDGKKLGEAESDYRYESSDCQGDRCKSYSLRADLEEEGDYIKTNRNK
jgi:type II secretory pathway pseudopilin PulG